MAVERRYYAPFFWRIFFILAAIVLFILTALGAFNTITWNHVGALGWIGLACFAAAFL